MCANKVPEIYMTKYLCDSALNFQFLFSFNILTFFSPLEWLRCDIPYYGAY